MIPKGYSNRGQDGNYGGEDDGNVATAGQLASYNPSTSYVATMSGPMNTERGTKSSWYELFTTDEDIYGFYAGLEDCWEPFLYEKKISFDIGIGPVGSEQLIVQDLVADVPSHIRAGDAWFIPLFIPRGTIMHMRRMLYANTTSGNMDIRGFITNCRYASPFGQFQPLHRSETVGIQTYASPVLGNGYGTHINPTVAHTKTSWVELGDTTFDWKAFHFFMGLGVNGINPEASTASGPYNSLVDFGVGPDSGNVTVLLENVQRCLIDSASGNTADNNPKSHSIPIYQSIPTGSKLWARSQCGVVADTPSRSVLCSVIGYG